MNLRIFTILLSVLFLVSCDKKDNQDAAEKYSSGNITAKVTFIELGSVNCIPCRQMQPVMKSIEEKFGSQVNVVFHDVWKDKDPAKKYGIQLIPTQVFLDENGKEFYRHEGFFAEDEIIKLFETRNVKPLNN